MMRRCIWWLAAVFAAALIVGRPAQAITLEEALVGLIETHPQIEADTNRVGSAAERVRGATSRYYPQVDVSSDYGVENIDTAARRTDNLDPYRRSRERATLSVTQNLFDGSRRRFERRGAEFDKSAAEQNLKTSRQNVLFEGASAYIDVLRQTELFELISVNERAVERQFALERERLEAGAGLAVDLLLAQSRVQLAKERRVLFRAGLQDSVSRYRQVFGDAPEIDAMVAPSPPVELLPETLADAIASAFSRNPVLASTGSLVDAARAREKAARADYFPRFDVVGAANFEDNVNAVPGIRRDWSVLLQARWNLFNGFATKSNVAGAAFDRAASLNNLRLVKRRVEEEVRFSWQGLQTSCERRFLLENAVDIALNVLGSRRRLLEAGQETALRVLDAETQVFNAQINLAAASFDESLSVYRMMLALGRLDTVVSLDGEGANEHNEHAPPLIAWCREFAGLDLREDDPLRTPTPLADAGNPFAASDDEDEAGDDLFANVFDDEDDEDGAGDVFASLSEDDDVSEPEGVPAFRSDDESGDANFEGEALPFQFDDDDDVFASISDDRIEPAPADGSGEDGAAPLSDLILFDEAPSTGDDLAEVVPDTLPRFEFENDDDLSRTSASED